MKLKIKTKYCQIYHQVMDSDGNIISGSSYAIVYRKTFLFWRKHRIFAKMAAAKAYVRDYPHSEAKDPIYREVKSSPSLRGGELYLSETKR